MIQRILHNSIFGVASQAIGGSIFFLISVFIARHLGPDKFGAFAFIIALMTVIYLLADFGISTIIAREISKNREKTAEILGACMPLVMILGIISYCLIIVLVEILELPDESRQAMYIMGCTVFFTYHAAIYGSVCKGFEDMGYNAAGLITRRIVLLAGVSLAIYFDAGIVEIVICYLIESFYEFLFFERIVRKHYVQYSLRIDLKYWKHLLYESVPLGMAILLKRVSWYVDTFVLTMLSTAGVVGVFSAAYRIVQMVSVIPFTLSIPLYPVLSRLAVESKTDAFALYKKALRFFMLIAIPIGVWVCILGPHLILLLFGNQYQQAGFLLQVMSGVIVLIFPNILYMYIFPAINKQKLIMYCMSVGFTVNLIMDFVLIPEYGFMGAAIATLLSELTIFISGLLLLMTQGLTMDYIRLFLRPLILTSVAATVLVWPYFEYTLHALLSASFLYGLIIITLYFLTKLIKVNELSRVLKRAPVSS